MNKYSPGFFTPLRMTVLAKGSNQCKTYVQNLCLPFLKNCVILMRNKGVVSAGRDEANIMEKKFPGFILNDETYLTCADESFSFSKENAACCVRQMNYILAGGNANRSWKMYVSAFGDTGQKRGRRLCR